MEYHVLINNQQAGPHTIEQLRSMWASGTVTLDTPFWTAGMPDWQPLRTIITTLQPPKPTPIVYATSASSRSRDPGSQPTPTSRRSYRSYAGAAVIGIVCVIAVAMVAMWMDGGRNSPSGSSTTSTRPSDTRFHISDDEIAESAEHLSAIIATYQMRVGTMRTVLKEMDTISSTSSVTNKETLSGLARASESGHQAGFSIEEILGIVASGIGRTGRSGAEVGDALTALLVAVSTPSIQEKLKNRFDFGVTDSAGDMKSGSEILSKLYVKYQGISSAQKQELLQTVGQKQHASQIAAMLDGYVNTQVLSIRAQRSGASSSDPTDMPEFRNAYMSRPTNQDLMKAAEWLLAQDRKREAGK